MFSVSSQERAKIRVTETRRRIVWVVGHLSLILANVCNPLPEVKARKRSHGVPVPPEPGTWRPQE